MPIIIENIYGGDIWIISKCKICGKEHKYRLHERQICGSEACYEESKKRKDKKHQEHPLYQ